MVRFSFWVLSFQKIKVFQVVSDRIADEHSSTETTTTLYGEYNLYQPVTAIGYKQDAEVVVPDIKSTPVFYLLYVYDYKRLRQLDSTIITAVDLSVNLLMFGPVSELGYLLEISDLAEVASLPAERAILKWEFMGGVSRLVQFTAGVFNAITHYIDQNSRILCLERFAMN